MSARLVGVKSRTEKVYTLTIEGAEVRDCRWSSSGRRYRPVRVTVTKRDGNVSCIDLWGPVQKKDGTDGANDHTETLWGEREWPAWLAPMVKGLA